MSSESNNQGCSEIGNAQLSRYPPAKDQLTAVWVLGVVRPQVLLQLSESESIEGATIGQVKGSGAAEHADGAEEDREKQRGEKPHCGRNEARRDDG